MEQKHLGSYSELLAAAWLLKQGYEVFRNVSAHGLADISAYDAADGSWKLFEVRTKNAREPSKSQPFNCTGLSDAQIARGVYLLEVDRNTGQCEVFPTSVAGKNGKRTREILERLAGGPVLSAETAVVLAAPVKAKRKPEFKCVSCQKPFPRKGGSHNYCSLECRKRGQRRWDASRLPATWS